jgi:trehalose 6-phosphate phosphatase
MNAPRRATPHLFKHWRPIASRIRKAPCVALFLDFDGTLAPIVPMPSDARIPPETKRALALLIRNPKVSLTLISGRRRADLMQRAVTNGVHYLGLYGWEHSEQQRASGAVNEALQQVRAELERELEALCGVWIEYKGLSLSVHFRTASEANKKRAQLAAQQAVKPFRKHLKIAENLRDWEVLPRICGDKGAAVVGELNKNGFRLALPIYIGDDISDEKAFRALKSGITIHVGRGRNTRAKYRVRGPAEVAHVLERIARVLE